MFVFCYTPVTAARRARDAGVEFIPNHAQKQGPPILQRRKATESVVRYHFDHTETTRSVVLHGPTDAAMNLAMGVLGTVTPLGGAGARGLRLPLHRHPLQDRRRRGPGPGRRRGLRRQERSRAPKVGSAPRGRARTRQTRPPLLAQRRTCSNGRGCRLQESHRAKYPALCARASARTHGERAD